MLILVRDGIITNVSEFSAASDEILKESSFYWVMKTYSYVRGKMNNGKRTRIHPESTSLVELG
jgi:hypothetical protein